MDTQRVTKGVLTLAVLMTVALSPLMVMPAQAQITFTGGELLGKPTDTSITINIVPASTIEYYYQYGTSSGSYMEQTANATATGGQPHEITITGLSPNTQYYYRMRYHLPGETDWVERIEHSFWTQRDPGSPFTFTITSDSHVNIMLGNSSIWTQTMTNVASNNPDFHLDLGDTFAMDNVTTVSGAESAYLTQRQYFDLVGHSASIFLAPGNHEQQEGWHLDDTGDPATSPPVIGTNAQKKYYLNPVPDSFYSGNTDSYPYLDGDQLREDYYAWTWGDVLFVVIDPFWYTMTKPYTGNTGGGETSDTGSGDRWHWTLGEDQFNWLKSTLEGSSAKYKFIFAHHMVGGSDDYVRGGANPAHLVEWGGYNEAGTTDEWATKRSGWGSEPIHQMLVNNGVSAFFHGHDHQYAYEKLDGVVYQALPAAGFSGSGFNIYTAGNGYTIQALPSPGHLRVNVSPTQATVDYIATSGGGVNYSYTIAPNASGLTHDLTMASDGHGTTDPSVGVHTYAENTVVSLSATPSVGYVFDSWTGDEDCANGSVTMDADKSCTAIFVEAPPSGEVTLDGTPTVYTATSTTSNAISFSHTTGTGANRLMLVGASWNSNNSAVTISSVTFTPNGGEEALPLTTVISQKHSSNYRYSAIYSLLNPPSEQTGTVTINFNSSISNGIVAGAANFAGVDQTTPLGTSSGASSPSNNTTSTVTLTGLNGDELVFDNVFLGGNPPADLTVGADQTQLDGWNQYASNTRGAASTEQAITDSVTMSWTADSSSMWVIAAVPINPAPVSGTTYTLTMAVDPVAGGTTDPAVGMHTYAENTVVSLSATPNSGYVFDSWTGDADCADGSVTMNTDKTCTANFVETPLTVDGEVSTGTGNNVSSISFTHTTGTKTNPLMLVGVSWNCGETDTTISSVTFTPNEGSAIDLTEVTTQQYYWEGSPADNNYRYAAIYSLLPPPSGVQGMVAISFSGAVSNGIIAGAINVAGVNPTTPLGIPNGAVGSSSGTPTAPTVDLTGLTGNELVFDSVFIGANSESQTMTADSGQAESWNVLGYSSSETNFNMRGAASTRQVTGQSATMSWTPDGYDSLTARWAIVAVPINPAPVGTTYDLTLAVDPDGSGTTDPAVGVHTYAENEIVTISATAGDGYAFDHWTGDVAEPDSASTTVTMDADQTVTAHFTANEYTVTVTVVGNGTVNNTPGNPYTYGQTATLEPVADTDWSFAGWSGTDAGELSDNGNGTWDLSMNDDKAVTATFTEEEYTVTVTVEGNGTVNNTPGNPYAYGQIATLESVADTGWSFAGWSGPDAGELIDNGNGTCDLIMNADKAVIATFTEDELPQPLPIEVGDEWRYFKGTEEPGDAWNENGFDDSGWLQGFSGFGYGDDDDATVLDDMEDGYLSVYVRKEFTVDDPSVIAALALSMDYDDGFVAYLNGTEIARDNVTGTPPDYGTAADDNHEASGGGDGASPVETYDVNPGLLVTGTNVLAVQGHNQSIGSSDFSLIPTLTAVEPLTSWIAYNDLNNADGGNAANVTEHGYDAENATLKDFDTGQDLPVSITVVSSGGQTYDDGGDFSTESSDAYVAFDSIVHLAGVYQLDDTSDVSTITFNDLDPAKEYAITLTANRDNSSYTDMRYTRVTIQGADTYVNASSSGVVINSNASVSFSTGYNTVNGYVAKWTGITASDGSFSIESVWDDSLGSGSSNTKGYAMSAFKLEQNVPSTEPTITITGAPLTDFSSEPGTPSVEQSYRVAGSNLTDDIEINAPTDFEISTTSGSDFGSSVTLTQSGGSVAGTWIYVRFNRATEGTSAGDISHTSGTISQKLPVSGEAAIAPTVATFQQGIDGYAGTVDTYLESEDADADNSTATTLVVDLDPEQHILLRFESIFGNDPGQIPPGAIIQSASLEINVTNASDQGALLHRMLQSWNGTDTWDTWIGGIDADGSEAETTADSSSSGSSTGTATLDVTPDVQVWSNNPSSNFGWAWLPPSGDDSWQFRSAEGTTPPKLTVAYFPPSTEPPAAPTALSAIAASSTQIDLSWTDNADNESGFEVWSADSGTPDTLLETVDANVTGYSDTGLDPETDYCYVVRAINSAGESDYTGVACATTEAAPTTVTLEVRVSEDDDDAEEDVSDNSVDVDSSDLEMIYDASYSGNGFDQEVGIRFQNVDVPVGATIVSAYIEFVADASDGGDGASDLTIYGQDADNPDTFVETDGNITGRPKTTASAAWNPGTWTSGAAYQTSDLTSIVQEIVVRGGWVSGNAMAFIVTGASGDQVRAESYDGSSTKAPLLVIEYSESTDPIISVTGTPLDAFSSQPGIPSAEQSYTVSGHNLTNDIIITPPVGFEISLTSGGRFVANPNTLTFTPVGGNVASTPIYVRFTASTLGSFSGDITHSSTGATAKNVAVRGTASETVTIEVRVSQSSDDAEQNLDDNSVSLDSTDLELIHDVGYGADFDQVVGLRFQNVEVPVGATIESAYIEFEVDETSSEATTLTIYGEAADNPGTFTSSEGNISSRSQTSASVGWAPGAWNTVSEKHQTENLSSIVQEIVEIGGWTDGNAMVFIIEGSGERIAEAYDGEPDNAPLLVIEYSGGHFNQAPDEPALVQPLDDATDVSTSPTLEVTVSDPDEDDLTVTFYGRAVGTTTEPGKDFTLVAFPDTQNESQYYPAVFDSQTQWVADNKTGENIVFVTHLGDIVNTADDVTQWENADHSMDILDAYDVAYSVGPGNHDLTTYRPSTLYPTYFGASRFTGKSYYGGSITSDNFNNYSLFSASGMDFILINLQYEPTTAMLDWADALLKANTDRRGIVVSHSILNTNDSFNAAGTEIFNALKDNPNIFLMLCGHMHGTSDGAAYREEFADDGHTIISIMLADYQDYPNGGNGYLRILRFSPADDTIYVTTYSPYDDSSITTYPDEMEINYDMSGSSSFAKLDTVSLAGSGNASITWPELGPGTDYEWYVEVSDDKAATDSVTWSFTTGSGANVAPVLAAIGDQSVDEETELSFTATASDSDPLTFSLEGAPAGTSITTGGAFSWTPTEAQGPGDYPFTVKVCDNGTPPLCDEETITVTVNEVNIAPVLDAIGNQIVDEETELTFTATATDGDLPANTLTFSLDGAPVGASITTDGEFSWTPTEPGDYTFTVEVCDDGTPSLCDEEAITVTVNEVLMANLTGMVDLQGRPDKPDLSWSVPLTVELYEVGQATLTYSFSPSTDSSGEFSISGITPGAYEIAVKNSHTLQVVDTVTLIAGSNSHDFGTLREGDANDDNRVTLLDFSLLVTAFNTAAGDPGYNAAVDFNNNGIVNLADFSLLATNFNQSGEKPSGLQ